MNNVYSSSRFVLVLDSTGNCGNIADDGDIADWFIEDRSCLYQITKNYSLTGQRKRENLF